MTALLQERYAVLRELGHGGMATVYLADDLRHGRQVAVKVLRAELGALLGPDRFTREIRIAAALNHPHILPLYDSGEAVVDRGSLVASDDAVPADARPSTCTLRDGGGKRPRGSSPVSSS